jgi:SAM-dependent methyltransferase
MKSTDLIAEFARRCDRSVVPAYEDREGRNRWAASFMQALSGSSVLNLGGGGRRHLEKYLGPRWHVHEVDITGDCDTKVNLDEIYRLPFEDESFDVCCAFEVLEHLDHFHSIADEMYRVSKSTILISLPNSAVEMFPILSNRRYFNDPLQNGVYSKYNGLPVKAPEDRHRWWLTFEDIVRYCLWYEKEKACGITFFIPNDEFSLKRKLFRLACGERLYLTLFCSCIWVRIQKKTGVAPLKPNRVEEIVGPA